MLVLPWATLAHAQAPDAQQYPSQPIRWLLPGPPGSPPDLAARIVSERLAAVLGQPIIVENRPGAGGTIALSAVAKAPPDGHTLGTLGINHVVAPGLLQQMPYDTVKDLAPVTQLVFSANILVVRTSSPLKTVAEIVGFAKANPARIAYSSAGNATPSHLAAELFRLHAGIDVNHVPYKGPPAAIAAVLGEQVDMAFVGAATVAPYIKSGRLRALATPAPRRLAAFPDLPTMTELGFAGFEIRDWMGIVAPATTPKHVITRLATEIASIIRSPEIKQRFASVGMEGADKLGPEDFGALIRSELPRWAKVVREAGIRAD
jgi:tripartite-type tricarboxylate transporter receptor subunit TctC